MLEIVRLGTVLCRRVFVLLEELILGPACYDFSVEFRR